MRATALFAWTHHQNFVRIRLKLWRNKQSGSPRPKPSVRQPGAIGGAMKTTTSGNTLGVKLFPFFFCGACALLLVLLALNGTIQKSQMFIVAAIISC